MNEISCPNATIILSQILSVLFKSKIVACNSTKHPKLVEGFGSYNLPEVQVPRFQQNMVNDGNAKISLIPSFYYHAKLELYCNHIMSASPL